MPRPYEDIVNHQPVRDLSAAIVVQYPSPWDDATDALTTEHYGTAKPTERETFRMDQAFAAASSLNPAMNAGENDDDNAVLIRVSFG